MAAAYVQEIQKQQTHGPYFLGGVCLGGVVAYEMAQQLTTAGESVALVALIDSHMPGKLTYLRQRKEWAEYIDTHLGELLLLRGSARTRYLLRWMANGGVRLWNALGFGERSSLGRATKRLKEAHEAAFLSYRPRPYQGKVVQLMCADGSQRSYEDRRLAWSSVVSSGLEVQIVPGNHLSMVEDPHVGVLAHELEVRLRRADIDTAPFHRGLQAQSGCSDDLFAKGSLQGMPSDTAPGLKPNSSRTRRERPVSFLPSALGGGLGASSGPP
jgi:thioesterase domain-containing protein